MMDGAGPDLFSCYGGKARTPHIDSLAAKRFYDTNGSSNPKDYVEITDSVSPEIVSVKKRFIEKLDTIPHLDLRNDLHRQTIENYNKTPYPHQMK